MEISLKIKIYKKTPVWCEDCYTFTPHVHLDRLDQLNPQQKPKRIFSDSMFDWNCKSNKRFWLDAIITKMQECKQHTFQILSKRPTFYSDLEFPDNVWIGTSITGKNDGMRLADLIGSRNNNLKFLSIEPLHGPFDYLIKDIDWIIIGAETGNRKGKIEPKPEWVESIVNNADAQNIPVFMKGSLALYWKGELRQEFPASSEPMKIE